MISTLHQFSQSLPILGMSRWMRTDLILAATLLFLVFTSWAMLWAAQTSLGPQPASPSPNQAMPTADPAESSPDQTRRGARRGFGTLGIVLGLLGSFTLLAICAW
jgi:hypothetical protein